MQQDIEKIEGNCVSIITTQVTKIPSWLIHEIEDLKGQKITAIRLLRNFHEEVYKTRLTISVAKEICEGVWSQ